MVTNTLKTLLFALILSAVSSVEAKKNTPVEAVFSYFEYVGDDDFYRENPLTDEQSFYNPILPGWFSDPAICQTPDGYFMVASTFTYFPGVPLYHSTDLVNWKLVGNILNRPSQLQHLEGQNINNGGIYAATINYDKATKTYYMITSDEAWGNFFVTTNNPFCDWSEPILLPDVNGIDPAFFFDDDGKSYIIHKENTAGQPKWNNNRALRIIRFDKKTGKTFGEDMKFCEEGVGDNERLDRDEGPHLYKINGTYYVIAAEGGTSWAHSEVVYKSKNVLGPYTRWGRNPMLTQRLLKQNRQNAVTCTGHADLVTAPDGSWWAVFLGCRPNKHGFSCLGRETFIMPVRWSADGYPFMTQSKDTIPLVLSRADVKRKSDVTFGNFTWRDDFTTKQLRPEWLSLWGSAQEFYRIKDGLHLACSDRSTKDQRTPAALLRRLQHHKFTAQTALQFAPKANERAGLLLMRNETHQYFMAVGKNGIELLQIGKGNDKQLAKVSIETTRVELKVVCTGATYQFYYRTNADWQLLCDGVDAAYLSNERGGGFIGTTVGVYAVNK